MVKNNNTKKRILACLLAGTIIGTTMLSGCSLFGSEEGNKSETSASSTDNSASSSDNSSSEGNKDISPDEVAAHSENYKLSKAMTAYIFNNYYATYREYAATYYGLDVTKSLKDQYYNQDESMTWYEYFMQMTTSFIDQMFIMCEAADAEGLKLDDADMETVNTSMDSIKTAAKDADMELDEYITSFFGEGVTEEQMMDYLKMTALSNKFYTKHYDAFKYTDEDYENYYKDNKTDYQYADFLTYNFSFANSSENSEESVDQDLKDKAKAYAEDLSKCKTPEEFKKYVKSYLEENPQLVTSQSQEEMTEGDIAAAIDSAVEKTLYPKYAYEVTSEAGKWLFDVSREDNETKIFENTDSYTVLMVTKTAYRDESTSKNVRHILFSPDNYGSEEEANKKAQEVYELWKSGDATEDSFAKLAEEYTDDPGSKTTGGLYEDVAEGTMVTEFNDWLFDSKRKPGDTGVVKTSYGYHIMYFVSDGEPAWKTSVDTVLRKEDFNEEYAELGQKYKVEYDQDVLNSITEKETSQEESEEYYDYSVPDEVSAADESASSEESKAESGN